MVFPEGADASLVASVVSKLFAELKNNYIKNIYPQIESGVASENLEVIADMIVEYYGLNNDVKENVLLKIREFVDSVKTQKKKSEVLKISDNVSIAFTSNEKGVMAIDPRISVKIGEKQEFFESPTLVLKLDEGKLIDNNSGNLFSGATGKDIEESSLFIK